MPARRSKAQTKHRAPQLSATRLSSSAMPTVAIWTSRGSQDEFLLAPVVETLRAGFAASPDVANVVVGHGVPSLTNRNTSSPLLAVLATLVAGDIFVWVGEFFPQLIGESDRVVPWRQLGEHSVRRIYYQCEPAHGCKARRPACYAERRRKLGPPPQDCREQRGQMQSWGPPVDELWDFSAHNLDACFNASASAPTTLRHVPIANVALTPTESATGVALGAAAGDTGTLLFPGNVDCCPLRHRCFAELRRLLGRSRVRHVYKAWSEQSFAQRVLSSSIFLNLHKDCGDAHNPVTWRSPMLLRHSKLVLSERASARDEETYKGMVLFFDNISAIAGAFLQLSASGEWRPLAARAGRLFRQQFEPTRVFERAGVYAGLRLRRPPGARRVSQQVSQMHRVR